MDIFARLLCLWRFSRQEYCSGLPCPPPGDLPNPGIEPRSPALQEDSLPAEQQGNPKNTGVGSLSLLQWISVTQELNRGLLHCRRVLHQLSYQGSPALCHGPHHSGPLPSAFLTSWPLGQPEELAGQDSLAPRVWFNHRI